MRAKIREILEECIELGIEQGIKVAHKYVDDPPHDFMAESIDNAIWFEIDQRFDFERNVCDEVVKGFDELEKEREWVYLTEEEMLHIVTRDGMQLAEAIEAKIRAKNG